MSACIRLLETQRSLERRCTDFCDSLHPERTVQLADLVSDPAAPQKLGIDHWFDQNLFRRRIRSGWQFLTGLPGELPRKVPLVFYQRTDPEEDRLEFARRFEFRNFRRRFASAPAEASYLMPFTNFSAGLAGTKEDRDRRIMPLMKFSSRVSLTSADARCAEELQDTCVFGYPAYDLPTVLGVSGSVATDYMAREIVHDLGHAWLPPVVHDAEPIHDAIMVRAMKASPLRTYRDDWERIVHLECTSPIFFATGMPLLESYMSQGQHDDHALFLAEMLVEHLRKTAGPKQRLALWTLPQQQVGRSVEHRVNLIMDTVIERGFARYGNQVELH